MGPLIEIIIAEGSVIDLIIFMMGIGVFGYVILLKHRLDKQTKKLDELKDKYASLDKLTLYHAVVIRIKLGVKTVRVHRSGDHEIVNPLNFKE